MKNDLKTTLVEKTKEALKIAEAYEKKLHENMKDIEENATIIKNRGEKADKEEDKSIIRRIQKDSYSFELLRENMNSILGVLKAYKEIIDEHDLKSEFSEEDFAILEVIHKNNMPVFDVDKDGNVVRANNEIADMAFQAIDLALDSESSIEKVLSSITKR